VSDVDVFAEHRGTLLGVAYRVLGRIGDAEDVVQETWLRWSSRPCGPVGNPRGYLVRITTRLAVDRLRTDAARRETYPGPWLPEPVRIDPDLAEHAETVSMAMLVVLETLSPLERAVFVLREAFGLSYAEIGQVTDRSEAAVRQLAHRAREHVAGRRPRFNADRQARQRATERFLAACQNADFAALVEQLAPGVTLLSDGGGKARSPRRPIEGAQKVARFFVGVADYPIPELSYRIEPMADGPAIVAYSGPTPITVLAIHLAAASERVAEIHLVANPDKLGGLAIHKIR
jgi:RNA polymerase sigma-70 factor, ECF subfamily